MVNEVTEKGFLLNTRANYNNSDFAFFVFERTERQPRRHLHSHLAVQRLSSEATTSCPNRDAPALPARDQRAVISFF